MIHTQARSASTWVRMSQASLAAGLTASSLRKLVDEVVAGEAAHREQQEPDDEQAERDRAELESATAASDPDCEGCDGERDEPHPVRDRPQDLRDRLRGLQLALLDPAIRPEDSGSLWATFPMTATWSPIWITIGRRSSTTAPPSVWMKVVSSSNSRTIWRCVRGGHLDPHGLHPWALERGVGCAIGTRAGEAGQNGCEARLRRRKPLGDRRLDVDVLEQRVDRLGRDLRADLVVLDHVPRDRLEALLVEGGVLDVERDHSDEREQDRDDREHPGADHTDAGGRLRGVGLGLGHGLAARRTRCGVGACRIL